MANALYDSARAHFLEGTIDWTDDTIKCVLVDATYVYASTDSTMNDIAGGKIVSGPTHQILTGKSSTGGAADAADVTFPAVSGAQVKGIVVYKYVDETMSNNPLIAYIDQATGLPITPNGGDIIVTWDNGVNKIFRL